MIQRRRGDQGQAFPIYIVMVAGLLFLALAFFAVGKAAATRNGAQGAADAAALAAAQDARDLMGPDFLAALLRPDGLEDFLRGNNLLTAHPCFQAGVFAGKNRADLTGAGCVPYSGADGDGFTVDVRTRYTVGQSVIPGTEQRHATAKATAVVVFRCTWREADGPSGEPGEPPSGEPGAGPSGEPGGDPGEEPGGSPAPVTFTCAGGGTFDIDPTDPGSWLDLADQLFTVHLVDVA